MGTIHRKLNLKFIGAVLAFVLGAIVYQSSIFAKDFLAVDYLDESIKNRRDIKNRGSFRVSKSSFFVQSLPDEIDFLKFKESGVEITFFKEIMDSLNALKPSESIIETASIYSCLHAQTILDRVENNTCRTSPSIKQVFSELIQWCANLQHPEFSKTSWTHGDFSPDSEATLAMFEDAEKLLTYAHYPLAQIDPVQLQGWMPMLRPLRPILNKLRYAEIHSLGRSILDDIIRIDATDIMCDETFPPEDSQAKTLLTLTISEASQNIERLTDIQSSGVQQAQDETEQLKAKGQCLPNRPYPSLTSSEREYLSMYLGGIYWRMRGGGLWKATKTRYARTYFNKWAMNTIGELNGVQEVGDEVYSRIKTGWGEWMDMGTNPGDDDLYYDLARMTDRGAYQVGPLKSHMKSLGYSSKVIEVSGLHMGACYFYSLKNLSELRLTNYQNTNWFLGEFIDGFGALGEFCAGASIATGVSKTVSLGERCL